MSTFPVLVLKNEVKIFIYSSLTLHETNSEMSGNLYSYQKQLHGSDLNIISYQYLKKQHMLCNAPYISVHNYNKGQTNREF